MVTFPAYDTSYLVNLPSLSYKRKASFNSCCIASSSSSWNFNEHNYISAWTISQWFRAWAIGREEQGGEFPKWKQNYTKRTWGSMRRASAMCSTFPMGVADVLWEQKITHLQKMSSNLRKGIKVQFPSFCWEIKHILEHIHVTHTVSSSEVVLLCLPYKCTVYFCKYIRQQRSTRTSYREYYYSNVQRSP